LNAEKPREIRERLSGFVAILGAVGSTRQGAIFVTQALPRIALVSTVVPPGAQGQAHVLGHLIGFPPPENCLLLADQPPFPPGTALEGPFANYRILRQRRIELKDKGLLTDRLPHLNSMVGVLHSVAMRAHEISQHAREFKASVLIACTASPFDLPACTLVAIRRRLPLVTYLFDDPIFQWAPGPLRNFARLWEPVWARVAAQVIVPNEAMAEKFTQRRRREPVIVRNPVSPEAVSITSAWPTVPGQFRIVYTGSVYHAQSDAFLNLLGALEELDGWSLHIYTSQTEAQVEQYGIRGPRVFHHRHVNQTEAYAQQRLADVLFLPLAFHSTIQEVLRTSAPMKMGEYLASGRPILAHAPPDTFVADHIRRNRAGLVVDIPDSNAIASALREIAANAELRQVVCANAVDLAKEYRVQQAFDIFWTTIRAAAGET
jgi:glycosyltransferase involved in cell wall biosynthesis